MKGLLRLETDNGRWATKDNDMIFSNIVYLVIEEDYRLYHLVDDEFQHIRDAQKEDIIC